jgi:hypothetical protein
MSPRDVLAELRSAQVEAPAELRARVRLIAAQAPEPRRPRRRFALVLVPVVAAAIAAGVFFSTRPSPHPATVVLHGEAVQRGSVRTLRAAGVPAPSPKRAQRYSASLQLEVKNVRRTVALALRVVAGLGGFPASVHVDTTKSHGDAELLLRVPRKHVQAAVARLGRLGAVTGEQVDIQDLQAGLNATDRTIARLQRELEALRAQPLTDATKREIAALTAHVVTLQRQESQTVRTAHFATVRLSLSTPPAKPKAHHHRHYLRDALPWLGGAAAALLLLLVLRGFMRLREAQLLTRF